MTEEVETKTNGEENGEKAEKITADLENKIIRQVEYYFGDVNLARDKFLQEQIQLDEGWVPLEILIKFNRLAKLSTDTDLIANALTNSTLEISEDKKKIRRDPSLPVPEMNEDRRKEYMARSVYAKGFPLTATLDDLLKYFNDFEGVEHIFMRKYLDKQSKTKKFKGSVFVQFKTKEQAEKLINTPDLKHGETTLILHWQADYIQKKQDDYLERKDQKAKESLKRKETEEKRLAEVQKGEFKLPRGTVFHFSECNDKIKREDIKDAITKLGGEVAYVEFHSGDKEGYVRLAKEDAAKEIQPKITDGKIKIGESEVVFKLLEGEEEKEFLDRTAKEMVDRRQSQRSYKMNKSKGFKGKTYGRKRKQDQPEDSEAPPAKVKADT